MTSCPPTWVFHDMTPTRRACRLPGVCSQRAASSKGPQHACRLPDGRATVVPPTWGPQSTRSLQPACRLPDGRTTGVTSTREIHNEPPTNLGATTSVPSTWKVHNELPTNLRGVHNEPPTNLGATTSIPSTWKVHNELPTNLRGSTTSRPPIWGPQRASLQHGRSTTSCPPT
ncbi:uncharacterized protein LOC143205785 [Rhynchophorus ferrugineus]|uniref:uncharacterized protein LOC143205785 n=1 Tax=Rhynchophorus ferrugineus TaxID=354439 RepID=UPI003FCDDB6B